jgi:hypothetical protein
MSPGNPIPAYRKCFADHKDFFAGKTESEKRQKWEAMPLDELPLKELRGYGGEALHQIDAAARLDAPDWQLTAKARKDGVEALTDFNAVELRAILVALKVRCRAELAQRRFDDALGTAKTMFALARHTGEHPTLLGSLVGTSFAILAVGTLEEMVQQPGCPNLYWALTDLPPSVFDFRKGIHGERMFVSLLLPTLDESEPMTEAQLQKAVEKVRELLKGGSDMGGLKEDAGVWLGARVKDEAHVGAARQRLVEMGLAADRVKKFPPLQVVLLDEQLAYLEASDQQFKGLSLPLWQAETVCPAPEEVKEGATLFGRPGPNILATRRGVARLEQRLALLRHAEALRMYAAENGGRLPAALEDVKFPLPADPVTGKPFSYKLDGQTAVLRGAPPGGNKSTIPGYRYEVTIRK